MRHFCNHHVTPGAPLLSATDQKQNPRLPIESALKTSAQRAVVSKKPRNHTDVVSSSSLQNYVQSPSWAWRLLSSPPSPTSPREMKSRTGEGSVEQWEDQGDGGRGCYRKTAGKTQLLILLFSHGIQEPNRQDGGKGTKQSPAAFGLNPRSPLKTRWSWRSSPTWQSLLPHRENRDNNRCFSLCIWVHSSTEIQIRRQLLPSGA